MYIGIGRGVQNLQDYTDNAVIETIQIESTQGSPNDTCKLTIHDPLSSFGFAVEDDLVITADPLTGVPSANLLQNPGFDSWTGGFPDGWNIDGPYDPVGIPFQQDLRAGYTYDGQGSLYIPFASNSMSDGSGNPLSWIEFYQTITLPRDRSGNPLIAHPYAFSMWLQYDAMASYNGFVYPQLMVWYLDVYGHIMAPQNLPATFGYIDMTDPFDSGAEILVVSPDTYTDPDGYSLVDGLDDHTWKRYSLITQPPVGAVSAHVAVSWRIDVSQNASVNPLGMHIDPNMSRYMSGSVTPLSDGTYPAALNITQSGQIWVDSCQFEYCTFAQKLGNYTPVNVNGKFAYTGTASVAQVPDSWSIYLSTTDTVSSPLVTSAHGVYNSNPNAIFIDIAALATPTDPAQGNNSILFNLPTFSLDGQGYQASYSPSTAINSSPYRSSQYGLFNFDLNQAYQITMTYKVLSNCNTTGLYMLAGDYANDVNGNFTNQHWQLQMNGQHNETTSTGWKTLTMKFGPGTVVPFDAGFYTMNYDGTFQGGTTPNPNNYMGIKPTNTYANRCLKFEFGVFNTSSGAPSPAGQYLIGDISITAIGGQSTAMTGGAYPTTYIGPGQPGAYYDGVAQLWFNQDRLFGGYIKTINSKYAGGYERMMEISAVAYGVVLDESPANIIVQNLTDVAAVQKAVTYAQNQGFAVGIDDQTYMTSISTIDAAIFTWTSVKDVIDKIADYSVAAWYVDYYRYIHFHPALSDTFTYSLSANPDNVTSFTMSEWEYESDGTQDLTSEVVEGSPQLSYPTTVSVTAASNYVSTIQSSNPRRYYRLGELAGATSIVDSSPYVINASVNGTVTFGQTGAITGDTNTAALLDGTTGYFSLPEYDLPTHNGNWSLEVWFKAASLTGLQVLGAFGNWGTTHECAHIALFNNTIYAGSFNDDTNKTTITSGKYYHAVATYDGGKRLRLYLNGQLAQEHIMKGSMYITYSHSTAGASLGADCDTASIGNFFHGTLDECGIYDHELSAQEVLDHYNASLGPVAVILNSGNSIFNFTNFTVNGISKTVGIKGTDSANNFQFLVDYNNGTVYDGSAQFVVGDSVSATFQFYYPVLVRVSSSSAESPTGSIGRRIYQYTQATELTSLVSALDRAQAELQQRSQALPVAKCTVITPGPTQAGVYGLPTTPILRPGQAINVYHPPSLGNSPQLFQVQKVTTTFAGNGVVIRKLELGSYLPNIVMHIVFLRRRVNRLMGSIGDTTTTLLADDQSVTDSWAVTDSITAVNIGNIGHWNGPSTWSGTSQWG